MDNLRKEEFIWANGSRGLEAMMVDRRYGGMKLRAHILNHKAGAKRINWE